MFERAQLALADTVEGPWHWWDHSGWYWAMGLHGLFWVALIAAVVALIVVLTRSSRSGDRGSDVSARSALDLRYARGEIDRGEYLERKRDLR